MSAFLRLLNLQFCANATSTGNVCSANAALDLLHHIDPALGTHCQQCSKEHRPGCPLTCQLLWSFPTVFKAEACHFPALERLAHFPRACHGTCPENDAAACLVTAAAELGSMQSLAWSAHFQPVGGRGLRAAALGPNHLHVGACEGAL